MSNIKIQTNGGTGALIVQPHYLTGGDTIALGFDNKQEVLDFQKKVNDFVENHYGEKPEKKKEVVEIEFPLGLYTHYKEGDMYTVYDVTLDEEKQEPRVSYMDVYGKKYSRFMSKFIANVKDDPENNTGQELRFEQFNAQNYKINK